MLKLPKEVGADPRHDAVVELLTTRAAPLWEGGRHGVATTAMTTALGAALRAALAAGLACQGLELIARRLATEQKGLDAARSKTPGVEPNARASRLLLIANDGSARFYRDCDTLLARHADRLIACRLDIAGEALGEALFGNPRLVRSVLVLDKHHVARALLALLPT